MMHQWGEHAYSKSGDSNAALIRAELDNLLASRGFAHANRLARFLRFVVELYLAGETGRLKESVIGIEVYDRPPDYDPKIDSIVRTEARRLRRKLQEYYEADGRHARVVITVPTGGYVPQIEIREAQRPALVVFHQPEVKSAPEAAKQKPVRRYRIWTVTGACILALGCTLFFAPRSFSHRSPQRETNAEDVQAHRLYLEGRYLWEKRTPDSIYKASERFKRALRLNPNDALALSGLADSYAVTASGLPSAERFANAKDAAVRALTINNASAEAHTSLAFVLYKFEWNWLEAERHFRRAIRLNPSYALAHHWFGEFLVLLGRFNEGLAELREAQALDPVSLPIKNDLARGLYRARLYDEALKQTQRALDLDPNFQNAHATLVYLYEQKGDLARAVKADLQVLRLSGFPQNATADLQAAFKTSGWKGYWRRKLHMLRDDAPPNSIPAYVFAEIYMRLGDRDAALRALEESFQEHGDAPLLIGVEPIFDPLRGDPRFVYLLRRSGLPERR